MNEISVQERIYFEETWVSEMSKYLSIIPPARTNQSDNDLEMASSQNHQYDDKPQPEAIKDAFNRHKNFWCDKEYLMNELIQRLSFKNITRKEKLLIWLKFGWLLIVTISNFVGMSLNYVATKESWIGKVQLAELVIVSLYASQLIFVWCDSKPALLGSKIQSLVMALKYSGEQALLKFIFLFDVDVIKMTYRTCLAPNLPNTEYSQMYSKKSFRVFLIIAALLLYPCCMIAGSLGFLMRIFQLVDSLTPFVGTHYVNFDSQSIFEIVRALVNYIALLVSISSNVWLANDVTQWLNRHRIFHERFWDRMLELQGFWNTFTATLLLNSEQLDCVLLITTIEILSQPVNNV